MTRNQIEYRKLLETQRSNIAQELLTRTRDQAGIEARLLELGETTRHNQVIEDQGREQLGISRITAKANRLNAESNARNADTNAHNAETNRRNSDINLVNARVNAYNADINAAAYQESVRSHLANESIGRTQATASLMSAGAAQQQAVAAAQNAATNRYSAETERRVGLYNVGVNQQRANTESFKAQTEASSVKSQNTLRQAQAFKAIADTSLTNAQRSKVEAEAKAVQIANKYAGAREVVGLIDKGTESLRDLTIAGKNGVSIYKDLSSPASQALPSTGGYTSYYVLD